jgi:uncharacterized protein (DUF488 family)
VSEPSDAPRVLTVGHSTRSLAEFLELLKAHGVQRVVDVRTLPRSRRNPQFNADTLPAALEAAGIGYLPLPGLGGLRRPGPGSDNAGWRNRSFRGYADYIQSAEFESNLETVLTLAGRETVALMCAEAVPWRCHRSLIADALLVRGVPVDHLLSIKRRQPHALTPWAQVEGTRLTYPPQPEPAPEPPPTD